MNPRKPSNQFIKDVYGTKSIKIVESTTSTHDIYAKVKCTNDLQVELTRIPAYITEEKEKQPLAPRPKRTAGKHHKKGDHLCCIWMDKLVNSAAQI